MVFAVMFLVVLSIAAVMLMASAERVFRSAFIRQRGDSDYLDGLPEDQAGRMRYGRAWLNDPRRELESVSIMSHDGIELHGHILHNGQGRKFVVLAHCYHSFSLRDFGCAAKFYYRLGYSVLLTDLRAHGRSGGRVICFGLNERRDMVRWVEMLESRFGGDIAVFLHGLSLGATTVTMAARSGLPACVRGIIADCGFTSPDAIVRHLMIRNYRLRFRPMIWALNALFWLRTRMGLWDYSTTRAMAGNEIAMLFIHGGGDDFVPTRMSEESYAACTSDKELFIVPGAGHAVSYLADARGYVDRVSRFIDSHI